jgi:putative ABC transport system permease protein
MLVNDIRYALRSLWHSKGFAIVAILCLGFGIGVNTTIFSVTDGVLLRPYPYPDPDRLVAVEMRNPRTDDTAGLSYLDLRDWNASSTTTTTIAGVSQRSMTVADEGREPERFSGAAISWDLFRELGVEPIHGHGFTKDDDTPGGGEVVILGYDLWTGRYRGDASIIGRAISVNGKPMQVVGIMPPRFAFPTVQKLWVPLTPMMEKDARDARGILAFARLKPAATTGQMVADLNRIQSGLARTYPQTNEGWVVYSRTLREVFLPSDVSTVIALMMVGVTLVLMIACSNVANLLLARATARKREISVRTALGAGRGRIIRQLLTESVVLALVSLPLAFLLAEVGTKMIQGAMPPDGVPYYITWKIDWRSLVYTIGIAVGTAVLFGLFPALQVSRGNLHENLKEGTRGNSVARSKLRSALVIVQVSFALVSLVVALLFVRSFSNLDGYQLGYNPAPLMSLRFYMSGDVYDPSDAKAQRVDDVLRRVESLPGVESAFASNLVPISGGGGGRSVTIDGQPIEPGTQPPNIFGAGVTSHFFKTMGVAVIRGRDLTDADVSSRNPVAIINTRMATHFWPTRDPLGARFKMGSSPDWFTVVGVVPDIKLTAIEPGNDQPLSSAFFPYPFEQSFSTGLTIRVAGGNPAPITSAVRQALRESDPKMPLYQIRTMEEARRMSFWQFGLYGWIFGTIGVVGLLLASVGVYGVLSYSVSQRTQEIGVRVALGASRRQVLGLIFKYGLVLVGTGVAAGLVFAPGATWLARSQLYNVSPFDPLTFIGVSVLMMLVAVVASYLPAQRATRVNPVEALRGE